MLLCEGMLVAEGFRTERINESVMTIHSGYSQSWRIKSGNEGHYCE
jgi:hypothetical protein